MMKPVTATLLDLLEGTMSFGSVNSIPQVFIKHLSEQSTIESPMYKQLKCNWFREYLLHHFTLKELTVTIALLDIIIEAPSFRGLRLE